MLSKNMQCMDQRSHKGILQIQWHSSKAIVGGKSIALKSYIRTSERFKIKRIYKNVSNFVLKTNIHVEKTE